MSIVLLVFGTIITWFFFWGAMWILEEISYKTGCDFFYITPYNWKNKWWSWLIAFCFTFLIWFF